MASSVVDQCLCLSTGTGTGGGGREGNVYRTDVQDTLSCTAEHIYTRMYFYKPLTSLLRLFVVFRVFRSYPKDDYYHCTITD